MVSFSRAQTGNHPVFQLEVNTDIPVCAHRYVSQMRKMYVRQKKKCSERQYARWMRSEVLHTCVTAQQRLVGEVVDKIVKGGELVKPEHVAAVLACHVKMLDRILRPAPRDKQTKSKVALKKFSLHSKHYTAGLRDLSDTDAAQRKKPENEILNRLGGRSA